MIGTHPPLFAPHHDGINKVYDGASNYFLNLIQANSELSENVKPGDRFGAVNWRECVPSSPENKNNTPIYLRFFLDILLRLGPPVKNLGQPSYILANRINAQTMGELALLFACEQVNRDLKTLETPVQNVKLEGGIESAISQQLELPHYFRNDIGFTVSIETVYLVNLATGEIHG